MDTHMMIVLGLEFMEAIICMIYAVFTYAILESAPEGKCLWHILLDNAIMVAAEAISTIYMGVKMPNAHFYVTFSLYIVLITQLVILYLLSHYIALRTKDYFCDRALLIVSFCLTICSITNPWTHLYFSVNTINNPVPGPIVFVCTIVAIISFVINLFKLMAHYRRFQNFWWIILMISVTLPFIALMYELSSWEFKWIHICNTISFVTIVSGYIIVNRELIIHNIKIHHLIRRERRKS